jgi:hypothetical protein
MDENVVIKTRSKFGKSITYPLNNTLAMTRPNSGLRVLSFPDFMDISSKSAGLQWTSTHQHTMKDE